MSETVYKSEQADPASKILFLSTELPGLEGVSATPTPEYTVWHDDGIPFLANSEEGVIRSITGTGKDDEILTKNVLSTYAHLMKNGQYGRASTLAVCAREITDGDLLSDKQLEANLAYIHMGLTEARKLLERPGPEEQEDKWRVAQFKGESTVLMRPVTPMKLNHFVEIYVRTSQEHEKEPDTLQPYMEYADEMLLELIARHSYQNKLHHEMWRFLGTGYDHPALANFFERVKSRDDGWKEQAAGRYREAVESELAKEHYGASQHKVNYGLATGLLTPEWVREHFVSALHSLDLPHQVRLGLRVDRMVTIDENTPICDLHVLDNVAGSIYSVNIELAAELEQLAAAAQLEVSQTLLANPPGDMSLGELNALRAKLIKFADQLPDKHPVKAKIQREDLERKIKLIEAEPASFGAYAIDRLVVSNLGLLSESVIDPDTFMINMDAIWNSLKPGLEQFSHDGLECFVGAISPFCRGLKEEIDESGIVPKNILELAMRELDRESEEDEFSQKLRDALERSIYEFFSLYWNQEAGGCGEYVS